MSSTGLLRHQGSVQLSTGGSLGLDSRQDFSAAVGLRQLINLVTGANTITVPTGSTCVVIVPPSDNAQTLILKGVTGDTGIRLKPASPNHISIDGAVTTTFVLTAGGNITGVEFTFL